MDSDFCCKLLKNSPFGYAFHEIVVDENGKPIDYIFLDCNKSFEQQTGLKKEAILNKRISLAIPKTLDDPFDWISFYGEIALNEGSVEFEQFSQAIGKWFKVQAYSPQKNYFATLFVDITEQKNTEINYRNAEKNLRESEERYRTLFEEMTQGVVYHDKTGKIVFANSSALKILGLTMAQITGRDSYHPEWRAVKEDFSDYPGEEHPGVITLKTGKPADGVMGVYNPALKDYIWILISAIPQFKSDEKEPYQVFATFTDITEQKRSKDLIEIAEKKAKEANHAKTEFVASMSHEIRTPLNSVVGFSELLFSTNLTQTQKEYARNIKISSQTLLDVVTNILDFSKIEAGKLELDEIEIDIFELINNVIDVVKFNVFNKKLEFIINLPHNIPKIVTVDPVRLKQVLTNLLSNAVKFTTVGEIELGLLVFPIDGLNDQASFTFYVKDSGIGISQDGIKNIFNEFSQADSSITRKFGGTGLGLTISNKILSKMGSFLEVESVLGKGSNFYFTVKLKYREDSIKSPQKIENIKRVLLIDSNETTINLLGNIFKEFEIEIEFFSNGIDAFKTLFDDNRSINYDLAIIDCNIPFLTGVDIIKIIRDKYKITAEELPIILITSMNNDIDSNSIKKELSLFATIQKPLKTPTIQNILYSLNDSKCEAPDSKNSLNNQNSSHDYKYESFKKHSIMLVEDVDINMTLAKIIISKIVPDVDIIEAKDGAEAVEKYKEFEPDFIFMDIQMPVMDGFLATQKIREIEFELGRRVPIVALTAGAIVGTKDRCFKAGMDDYITKPIKAKDIEDVLFKYFERYMSDNEIFHFDKNSLLASIDSNKKIYYNLLNGGIQQLVNDVDELKRLINSKDFDNIKKVAHKLKGSSAYMYCGILSNLSKQMEKESDIHTLESILNKVESEIEIIKKMFNDELEKR
ncbi:response regulator [bacterium]|nr:response regulator [bacterium]